MSDKSVRAAGKLYDELDRLRAEVASLKEENEKSSRAATFWMTAAQEAAVEFKNAEALLDTEREIKTDYGRRIADLTQQLAAAKEYAERLREAGQAVVDRWHSPNWKDGTHTADYINRLRDAIRKSEG